MRHRPALLALAAFAPVLVAAPAFAQRVPADARVAVAGLTGDGAFVENRGQWPDEVLFLARLGGADAWVTANGVTFDFYVAERIPPSADSLDPGAPAGALRRGHVVAMRFEDGHARRAVGHGRREGYHNYFLGRDSARWASRSPLYDEVVLEGIYDGVDLRLYVDEGGLRYDLVAAPGADVSVIRMRLEGAESVALTTAGTLRAGTVLGPVEHRGLVAYHEGSGGRREGMPSAFTVGSDGVVGFEVHGADRSRRLVIDPLVWASFLGGGGNDEALGLAADTDGTLIVAGRTTSADFPVTPGAYDTSQNGGAYDAFLARLSSDGVALLYATYLGGTGSDYANAVAVGTDGSATLTGFTDSSAFPTTAGAYDATYGGNGDAFVTRLSAAGDALVYSTYFGQGAEEGARGVALGTDGSATVAGYTKSTPDIFTDAFVIRVYADGTALHYLKYLGGEGNDRAQDVVVAADGSATIAAYACSIDYPTTSGAYDTTYNGDCDAAITRVSSNGATLYSTYLGGSGNDLAAGVSLDAGGNAVVVGSTGSTNFPRTPGAYDVTYNGGEHDAFLAKLSSDGTSLLYSTFLGGSLVDRGHAVGVGADGTATVVGYSESATFPTTPDAFDPTHNGAEDAYVVRLSPEGSALLYGTFLGGLSNDLGHAVVVDANGRGTVAGYTMSAGFPTSPGAYDTTHNGGGDAFIAQLDIAPDALSLTAVPLNSPVPVGERLHLRVNLTNDTPSPFSGDLLLEVESQGGFVVTRTLVRNATLPPGQSAAATIRLRVPRQAPLGLYLGSVTALEGGTAAVAESAFAFRVIEAIGDAVAEGEASRGTREGGATWIVELLDGGGLFPEATAEAVAMPVPAVAVWPNPARDRVTIAFTLTVAADVRLSLYDLLGREVASQGVGRLTADAHRLSLDLSRLPAGLYVWRLVVDGRLKAGRLTVVR